MSHAHHSEDEKAAIDLTSPCRPAAPVARSRAIGLGSRRRTKPSSTASRMSSEASGSIASLLRRTLFRLARRGRDFDHVCHLRSQI